MAEFNLHNGDCLDVLKTLADNSIDSIVTDPPYGLSDHGEKEIVECMQAWMAGKPYVTSKKGFMGKTWDSFVPGPEVWREAFRVLKPGAYMIVFASTRTDDLMSLACRLAGFRKHPTGMWVFGSGFPKATSVEKRFIDDARNISKWFDNDAIKDIITEWKNYLNNVKCVGVTFQKSLIETGMNTPKSDFVRADVCQKDLAKSSYVYAIVAELNSLEVHPTLIAMERIARTYTVPLHAELKRKQQPASNVEKVLCGHQANSGIVSIVPSSATTYLCKSTEDRLKGAEVLKTWRGNGQCSKPENINVLCAELTEDLKRITLSRSKTFQSLDTQYQTECAYAISVTITEYIAECLITLTVDIAKNAIDTATDHAKAFDGWFYGLQSLKPAYEPWLMFQKPHEGRMTDNVLKFGTGAINIEACRVPLDGDYKCGANGRPSQTGLGDNYDPCEANKHSEVGRWPANIIHDGSDAVVAMFPTSAGASAPVRGTEASNASDGNVTGERARVSGAFHGDSGSAARFFTQCQHDEEDIEVAQRLFYCPKASKADREEGLIGFDSKALAYGNQAQAEVSRGNNEHAGESGMNTVKMRANNHPTVKPTALMRHLVRLITPPGGTCLDLFMGSGSTGKAAMLEGFDFIGIEMDAGYAEIARARVEHAAKAVSAKPCAARYPVDTEAVEEAAQGVLF